MLGGQTTDRAPPRRGLAQRVLDAPSVALAIAMLVLLAGAIAAPAAARVSRRLAGGVSALAFGSALALVAAQGPSVATGAIAKLRVPWVPRLGLEIALRLDGLSFVFAVLVLGIGMLVVLYAAYYLPIEDRLGRFLALLLLFAAAMTGLVLSDNLLLLVIFWELTSLTSFFLIAYWHDDAEARRAALTALTVTGAGGLALLGGVVLIARIVGSFDVDVVLASGPAIRAHRLYAPAVLLVLAGAFSKSAQFPFHFWLPRAMAAPTPISAYLHSATMVKAGIFVLARLHAPLAGTDLWFGVVCSVGLVTLVGGAYAATRQDDLKGLLAYSTISHLGLIVLLLGFSTPAASIAAVFHTLNHATFKASLFMAAGILDHETGTRDIRVLNGVYRHMPRTAVLACVSAAAMAGVPLLNGFLSKEMFFAEAIAAELPAFARWTLIVGVTLAGLFGVTYSARFVHDVFFRGEGTGMPKLPHEPRAWMRVPVELLSLVCIVVGVVPAAIDEPFVAMAARVVVGADLPPYDIALWHGLTWPLLMTAIALVGGVGLYASLGRVRALHDRVVPRARAAAMLEASGRRAMRAGASVTAFLGRGSLQRYVALLLVAAAAAVALPVLSGGTPELAAFVAPDPLSGTLGLVAGAGAVVVAVVHERRYVAVVVLSAVGSIVALAFVRLSAPDLALTQLLVEIVSILLMLLALHHLPRQPAAPRAGAAQIGRVALAALVGLGAAALSWALLSRPAPEGISAFFLRESVPAGGGRNVVNVILVDFRAFDTLGEITVLGAAGLGAAVMLDGMPRDAPDALEVRSRDRAPVILVTISRTLLPLALVFSAFLFLRGHNRPGGGFVAALVTTIALLLQYLASGTTWTHERLRRDFLPVFGVSLLVALGAGLASTLLGAPFLTMWSTHVDVPVLGEIELATAMVFDFGVYLAVVSSSVVILARLGEISRASSPVDETFRREASPWLP